MQNFEKPILKVLDQEEEITSCEEASHKLFREMPEAEKREFLAKAQERFSKEALGTMYNIPQEELESYLGPEGVYVPTDAVSKNSKEEVIVQELSSPVTSENIHLAETELTYPIGTTTNRGLPQEILAYIRSVCSMADQYRKPYAQIAFANGTGIFTYKKLKNEYIPSLVIHPDVVDDLVH